jgi:hypothetical protein
MERGSEQRVLEAQKTVKRGHAAVMSKTANKMKTVNVKSSGKSVKAMLDDGSKRVIERYSCRINRQNVAIKRESGRAAVETDVIANVAMRREAVGRR